MQISDSGPIIKTGGGIIPEKMLMLLKANSSDVGGTDVGDGGEKV